MGLNLARLLAPDWDAAHVLAQAADSLPSEATLDADAAGGQVLGRVAHAGSTTKEIARRSIDSLAVHRDVSENDVAQFIWGCYGCGYLIEGERPDACPNCGALSIEFEWFGPFYSTTPEHLGQLQTDAIVAILAGIPDEVASTVGGVPDAVLSRKPAAGEWCAKEIIGHMLETDLLFTRHVQAILQESGIPVVPRPAPPWKLHQGKGYEHLPADELLARHDQARAATLSLVRSITPEDWVRQGLISGTPTSVLDLGTWLANHDRGHLAQVVALSSES